MLNWTLAVLATVCAFVVHLAMRGRTVSLGYELGKARNEQMRLREVKRVLELESASYETPERVEMVVAHAARHGAACARSHRDGGRQAVVAGRDTRRTPKPSRRDE